MPAPSCPAHLWWWERQIWMLQVQPESRKLQFRQDQCTPWAHCHLWLSVHRLNLNNVELFVISVHRPDLNNAPMRHVTVVQDLQPRWDMSHLYVALVEKASVLSRSVHSCSSHTIVTRHTCLPMSRAKSRCPLVRVEVNTDVNTTSRRRMTSTSLSMVTDNNGCNKGAWWNVRNSNRDGKHDGGWEIKR
jgi:hypothetical protein